jgi:hypothetical protein
MIVPLTNILLPMPVTITTQPGPKAPLLVPRAAATDEKAHRRPRIGQKQGWEIHGQNRQGSGGAPCLLPVLPLCSLGALFARKHKGIKRDFERFETIVDIPQAPQHVWAVSDIHGDYDRFVALAGSHGLLDVDVGGNAHWAGHQATLLVLGDLIDKGPKNFEMLELMQQLEGEAKLAGGRVITLFGNHEVQFLANPYNDKAMGPGGIFWDLAEWNVDPKHFASDKHPTGAWLHNLPFGARVGNWFFAHGGQTSGRSLEGLGKMLEVALTSGGFKDALIGGPNSLVRGRNWYGDDAAKGQENARLLGVEHIVFGHDPDTIAPRGKIVGFPEGRRRQLFRIDTGLSVGVDYSHGEMLHIQYTEKGDLCQACGPHGKVRDLGLFDRP